MPKTAMLVIDMQNALILEHPYDEKRLIKTVSQMEKICRDKGIEVIFVRHEDNTLVKGEAGFEINTHIVSEGAPVILPHKEVDGLNEAEGGNDEHVAADDAHQQNRRAPLVAEKVADDHFAVEG